MKKIVAILIITFITIGAVFFFSLLRQEKEISQISEELQFKDFIPLGGEESIKLRKEEKEAIKKEKNELLSEKKVSLEPQEFVIEKEEIKENEKIKLRKISNLNISGFTVLKKEKTIDFDKKTKKPIKEQYLILRYVQKETDNIFERIINNHGEIESEKRIAFLENPLKNLQSYFVGDFLIFRLFEGDLLNYVLRTFIIKLPINTQRDFFISTFLSNFQELEQNISDLSYKNSKIFYLVDYKENGVIGNIFDLQSNKKERVFKSSFNEWQSQLISDNLIALSTKPTYYLPSYTYLLDIKTKILKKVLGGINGGTFLYSPSGRYLVFNDSEINLNLFDIKNNQTISLGIKTLPEKCVWTQNEEIIYCGVPKEIKEKELPDLWYQDFVSFSDNLWKINLKTKENKVIFENLSKEQLDFISLTLDEKEEYLFFINKINGNLFIFKI